MGVSMPESGSPPLWPPTLSMSWSQDMTHTQSTWTTLTGISSPLPTLMDTPTLLTLTDCGERPGHHREEDVSVLIQTETGTSIGERLESAAIPVPRCSLERRHSLRLR